MQNRYILNKEEEKRKKRENILNSESIHGIRIEISIFKMYIYHFMSLFLPFIYTDILWNKNSPQYLRDKN